jgi:hypothetical protein
VAKIGATKAGRRGGSSARANQVRAQIRSEVRELSETRRPSVYRTDVEFAPEPPERQPGGSSKRWVEPIRALYARGMSQLDVANELDISPGYVSQIVLQYKIVKGKRDK